MRHGPSKLRQHRARTHALLFEPGSNDPISLIDLDRATYALMRAVSAGVEA